MRTLLPKVHVELTLFLTLAITSIFAQNTEEEQRQEMSLRQQIVWPTTPEASSLGEYGDVDVNLYTGTANFTLAGPSLQGNHISMPVSMNYATGGIKVEDAGTWVGLGWSMVAGGSITRAVRNVPDTKSNYYDKADSIAQRLNAPSGTPDFGWYAFYKDVARNAIEVNHDIYYYSFNGRSGKFYISPNKEIFQATDSDLLISPVFRNIDDEITAFIITDEYGHQYLFDVIEQSRMQLDDVTGPGQEPLADDGLPNPDTTNAIYDRRYNSTWHLSEIQSYGSYERIALSYTTISDEYELPINPELNKSRTFTTIDANGCCGGQIGGTLNEGNNPALSVLNRRYLDYAELFINSNRIERLDFEISDNSCSNNLTVDDTDRKLDRIKVSRRNLNGGNTLTNILDYRFTYDCSTNRLTLLTFGETTAGSNNYSLKPPYSFEYIDALPMSLTSTSIDHWGYYNGANNGANLIPSYSSAQHSYSGANRNVNPNYSDHGSLYRLHYPTGGYTELDYSSNTRATSGSSTSLECDVLCQNFENCTITVGEDCCDTQEFISTVYSFTPDADDIADGVLVISSDSICGSGGPQALMAFYSAMLASVTNTTDSTMYQTNFNQAQSSMQSNLWSGSVRITATTGNNTAITLLDVTHTESQYDTQVDISSLTAGVTYDIEISGFQTIVLAELYHEVTTAVAMVESLGGIRISSLTNHESDGTVLTKKRFDYSDSNNNSTGRLMNEPDYQSIGGNQKFPEITFGGCTSCCEYSCSTMTLSATSRSTLGTTQGSVVGYDQVTEIITSTTNDNSTAGKTVHYFHNVAHSQNPNDMDHRKNGKELHKEIYHADGRLLVREDYSYSWDIGDDDREHSFFTYRIIPSAQQDNQEYLFRDNNGNYFWDTEIRSAYTGFERIITESKYERGDVERMVNYTVYRSALKRKELFYDENLLFIDTIISEEHYVYGDTSHLQITQSTMVNSDQTLHEKNYTYLNNYTDNVTIANSLVAKHKLLPAYKSIHVVSGDTLDGERHEYAIYNNVALIDKLYRYERTWDAGQVLQAGAWVEQSDILSYDTDKGLITGVQDRGWIPRSYTYNLRGQALSNTIGSYVDQIEYDPNTHLMDHRIAVDGTAEEYSYDNLLRLSSITNCQGVVSSIDYNYGSGTALNSVVQTAIYPTIGIQSNQSIINSSFVDGIGRSVQQLRFAQAPEPQPTLSIFQQKTYDLFGRQYRSYEPFVSNIATAEVYSDFMVPYLLDYTQQVIELSPLQRAEATTPPQWYATTTGYQTNVSGEVMNHTTGAYYAPGTLYKVRTVDPEGQVVDIYIDKRGNEILRRIRKSILSTAASEIADTYTLYDLKDRPILILPPETDKTDADLIFSRVYSGDDLELTKVDPDCDPIEMRYDDRDILIARQDGERRADGLWYRLTHDVYGNILTEGFSASPTGSVSSPLISNTWGASGIQTAKLTNTQHKELIPNCYINCSGASTISTDYQYDLCGRLAVTLANSILYPQAHSVLDSFTYDSQDNIIMKTKHIVPDDIRISRRSTYDHIGRLYQQYIQIATPDPDNPGGHISWPEEPLSQLSYDIKELITDLNLGNGLQNIDYSYRSNRLLTGINNTSYSGFNNSDDLFGMNIGYDTEIDGGFFGSTTPLKDGNISNIQWSYRTPNNTIVNKNRYSYDYNFLKQLTQAEDRSQSGLGRYTTTYSYQDHRGNFQTVTRKSGGSMIDDLNYTYRTGTNQIKSVGDVVSIPTQQKKGFKANTSMEYVQDNNGYITMDAETGAAIVRDHLNLMSTINIGDLNIQNHRTADGILHRRTIDSSAVTTVIDRMGEVEYRNGKISLIHHNDGYILFDRGVAEELRLTDTKSHTMVEEGLIIISDRILTAGADEENRAEECINMLEGFEVVQGAEYLAIIDTFELEGLDYFYTIKDHLGSPRVTFTDANNDGTTEVVDVKNYYAFGLEWDEEASQTDRIKSFRKSYNDKEAISYTNYLEFEARGYFKSINIFDGPDPISSQFPWASTGNYAENSPVANIDLWGLQATTVVTGILNRNRAFNKVKKNLKVEGHVNLTQGVVGGDVRALGGKLGLTADLGSRTLIGVNGDISGKTGERQGNVVSENTSVNTIGLSGGLLLGGSVSLTNDQNTGDKTTSSSISLGIFETTNSLTENSNSGGTKNSSSSDVGIGFTAGVGFIGIDMGVIFSFDSGGTIPNQSEAPLQTTNPIDNTSIRKPQIPIDMNGLKPIK